MRPSTGQRTLSWIAWSLLILQGARGAQEPGGCPHPPVPQGAAYVNVTGGLGEQSWGVRYICDTGEINEYPDICDRASLRHYDVEIPPGE